MSVITSVKDLNKKIVIVRVDFNVPIKDGRIEDDTKITNAISTIEYLIKNNCKLILISHLGRPNGYNADLSLKILLQPLVKLIGANIVFCPDLEEVESTLSKISYGEVILMENIRFYAEEEANDIEFAKKIASLADMYVNDAFACSHRNHASIALLNLLLPSSAGIGLAKEVRSLHLIFDQLNAPVIAIIGGAKISTKLKLIACLAEKIDQVIICGALANNVLKARGVSIGQSRFEKNIQEDFYKYKNIILPRDVITAENIDSESHICDVRNVPASEKIFDIGPASIIQIKKALHGCKAVLWNGPVGLFEIERFNKGTNEIAKTIASLTERSKLKSIIGGGDSIYAIAKSGVDKESFTHLSTAGGAFLEWVAEQKLLNLSMFNI